MRHSSSGRRSRNRNNNGNNRRSNKSKVFDSNGPDVRIRGTAHQVCEKYMALAKDASGAGDYILAQSYLQHAEHYQRFISGWVDAIDQYTYTGEFPESFLEEEQSNKSKNSKSDSNNEKSGNVKSEPSNRKSSKSSKNSDNDDLGLPGSITGDPVKTLEDA